MTGMERNLLVQFLKVNKHIRENSFRTRKRYRQIFSQFLSFTAKTFRLQNIKNISQKHIIAYVLHLRKENKSPQTILTHLSAIRFYGRKIGFSVGDNQELFTKIKEKAEEFTGNKEGEKE